MRIKLDLTPSIQNLIRQYLKDNLKVVVRTSRDDYDSVEVKVEMHLGDDLITEHQDSFKP